MRRNPTTENSGRYRRGEVANIGVGVSAAELKLLRSILPYSRVGSSEIYTKYDYIHEAARDGRGSNDASVVIPVYMPVWSCLWDVDDLSAAARYSVT